MDAAVDCFVKFLAVFLKIQDEPNSPKERGKQISCSTMKKAVHCSAILFLRRRLLFSPAGSFWGNGSRGHKGYFYGRQFFQSRRI